MEEIAAMLRSLQADVQMLKANADAATSSRQDELDMPVDVEPTSSSYDETEPRQWKDVLKDDATQPASEAALRLSQLLGNPPPLGQVRASGQAIPHYHGTPRTPPARRHNIDTQLFVSRKKNGALNGHAGGLSRTVG